MCVSCGNSKQDRKLPASGLHNWMFKHLNGFLTVFLAPVTHGVFPILRSLVAGEKILIPLPQNDFAKLERPSRFPFYHPNLAIQSINAINEYMQHVAEPNKWTILGKMVLNIKYTPTHLNYLWHPNLSGSYDREHWTHACRDRIRKGCQAFCLQATPHSTPSSCLNTSAFKMLVFWKTNFSLPSYK